MGNNHSKIPYEATSAELEKALFGPKVLSIKSLEDLYELFTRDNKEWLAFVKNKIESQQAPWSDVCDHFIQFTLRSRIIDKQDMEIILSRMLAFNALSPPHEIKFGEEKIHLSEHLLRVAKIHFKAEDLKLHMVDINIIRMHFLVYQGERKCKEFKIDELNYDNYIFAIQKLFERHIINKTSPEEDVIMDYVSLKAYCIVQDGQGSENFKDNYAHMQNFAHQYKQELNATNALGKLIGAKEQINIIDYAEQVLAGALIPHPDDI